jgi:alanyl-tRNA synthetase
MNIRKEFLDFFEKKGHKKYSSMSLIPDDATLLFVNAGMVQFKDVFTGTIPTPENPKATSCQLCLRAGGKHNDLENVGYTRRHHTLFEMLGNFSFGDYFKEEVMAFAWEFITEVIKLPVDRLWVTIHDSDDEAFELWKKHISEDRIKRFGDKDNFWSMGDTGACGPCSEIFYDQGEENFSSDEDYLGGEGDRFLEIWNLVFMQYNREVDGTLTPLPKPSIDTGMGLERIQAIVEGVHDNYDSSIFMPIIDEIAHLLKKPYVYKDGASYRVIADHVRAVSFMLINGVTFDKEGRGYVLRRILRRAVRHGYLLGFSEPFLYKLVDKLSSLVEDVYQDLLDKKEYIKEQIQLEEERFFKTISKGMAIFKKELEDNHVVVCEVTGDTKKKSNCLFNGEVAFKLYDTYGFPLDLTEDMLRDDDIKVNIEEFNKCMEEQKQRAKANWKGSGDSIKDGDFKELLAKYGENDFIGYNKLSNSTNIRAIFDEEYNLIDTLKEGESGFIMLKQTPFYAQSGGQAGDIGTITIQTKRAKVLDTIKIHGLNLSKIVVENGELEVDEAVNTMVLSRDEVAKHHSATHLLQSALKQILGDNVSQAGSSNDAKRLRFDFTYPKALTYEEIKEVEYLVNILILNKLDNQTEELPIEEAKKKGAIAMFGEKYGDNVRVVNFSNISIEFCGGTHVKNSSEIGTFIITKESGVSAGVRRIEAVCGLSAVSYMQDMKDSIAQTQDELKNKNIIEAITKLKTQIKELKEEVKILENSNQKELNSFMLNDIKIVIDTIENGDLKNIVDNLKNENEKIAIMLFQPKGEKITIVSGSKDCHIKAGDWIKNIAPIVGGGGGGRPDFAQAGGKQPEKINEALNKAKEYIENL